MKIRKILNNNAALTLNHLGQEVIVMGKGLAFQKKVGDGMDVSLIDKIFPISTQEAFHKFQELLSEIPIDYFKVSSDIVEKAKMTLGKKLNESIYLSLSDHMFNALSRFRDGIVIKNALLWDIRRFYPDEFDIGLYAINQLKEVFDVRLPEDEAGFIALHIVNAAGHEEHQDMYQVTKMMQEISQIVKYFFKIEFNETSVYFYRFISHLKFFAQRVVTGSMHTDDSEDDLLMVVKEKYKNAFDCVEKIGQHVQQNYYHMLTNEEKLYLTVHIHRVVYKNEP